MPLTRPAQLRTPRRALVTGAGSGLGLALTRRLVAGGDAVLATDLARARPDALPEQAAYRPLDVRSEADWAAAMADVQQRWGGLDLLINNAGIGAGGRFETIEPTEWDRIVDINLLGVVRGCRAVVPVFRRQGHGQLVNIASVAGLVHGPRMASYNVTKAGVVALSETLAHELAPDGIQVSVVCPGFFRSNLAASLRGGDEQSLESAIRLITGSPRSAELIAQRTLAGVEAGHEVILTDRFARGLAWGKRLAGPVFRRALRGAVERGWHDRPGRAAPAGMPPGHQRGRRVSSPH